MEADANYDDGDANDADERDHGFSTGHVPIAFRFTEDWDRSSGKDLKEWIKNNPVSAITAFSTLLLSIMTTILSLRIYKNLIAEITAEESERKAYEFRTSEFVRHRQLLEKEVSWFLQAWIKL